LFSWNIEELLMRRFEVLNEGIMRFQHCLQIAENFALGVGVSIVSESGMVTVVDICAY
jgi:hypothetical protein